MKKILIVDDDSAILDCMKIMLKEEGYKVITSLRGDRVKKEIHSKKPDLILLDIWLSDGTDGGEIVTYLKSNKETKHIPIILISALTNIQQIVKKSLADDFVRKPFEIDDVLNKVGKHINKNEPRVS